MKRDIDAALLLMLHLLFCVCKNDAMVWNFLRCV